MRLANYIRTLRRDLLKLSEAAGVAHPALLCPDDVALADGNRAQQPLSQVYAYRPGWGVPGPEQARELTELMH